MYLKKMGAISRKPEKGGREAIAPSQH